MITRVILVEGSNDLSFIKWLISKANIIVPEKVKLVQVGGKPQVKPYVLDKIIGRSYDKRNDVSYEDADITHILLIKDYDLDDREDEFTDLINDVLQNHRINMSKYYISGTDNPPQVLETLLIHNDGDLLKEFHRNINKFNGEQNIKLAKVNDKNIFEAYLKLNIGRIEYTDRILSEMFQEESFLELPDIKKLIEKIREFIKEQK